MNIRLTDPMAGSEAHEREYPPPFSTWNRLYVAVVIYTLVLVAALYCMTVVLNR